eukprot:10650450-Alexandrium_andersonii.AAC.1
MQRRTRPSGASGTVVEAVSGPAQFKLRTPQAIPHVLRSQSSGELQELCRAPGSSGKLWRAWVWSTYSTHST